MDWWLWYTRRGIEIWGTYFSFIELTIGVVFALIFGLFLKVRSVRADPANLFDAWGQLKIFFVMWAIGSLILVAIGLSEKVLGNIADQIVPLVAQVGPINNSIARLYGELDAALAPATLNVLILILISTLILKEFRYGKFGFLFFSILIVLLSVAIALGAVAVLRAPFTLMVYAGLYMGLVPALSRLESFTDNYGINAIWRGIKVRQSKEVFKSHSIVLVVFAWCSFAFLGFWYRITVAEEVQIALYAAAIGGLLAVAGFAALVFSFSFEMIAVRKIRRAIADDTKSFQGAVLLVIVTSVIGMLLSNGPIVLRLDETSFLMAARAGLFVCAVSGLFVATASVLLLFSSIANILTYSADHNERLAVLVIEDFDCSETSIHSAQPKGYAELRNYLERQGCSVTAAETGNSSPMLELGRPVAILPRHSKDLSERVVKFLLEYVQNGGVLWIFSDPTDWAHKRGITRQLGYYGQSFDGVAGLTQVYPASKQDWSSNSDMIIVDNPLLFSESENTVALMRSLRGARSPELDANCVAMHWERGQGLVILSGCLTSIENRLFANLQNAQSLKLLIETTERFYDGKAGNATAPHAG